MIAGEIGAFSVLLAGFPDGQALWGRSGPNPCVSTPGPLRAART
jgi:hypothetical protein